MAGKLSHRLFGIHDCYVESHDGCDDDYTTGITDLIGFDKQSEAR
jgi:hypothetical protein